MTLEKRKTLKLYLSASILALATYGGSIGTVAAMEEDILANEQIEKTAYHCPAEIRDDFLRSMDILYRTHPGAQEEIQDELRNLADDNNWKPIVRRMTDTLLDLHQFFVNKGNIADLGLGQSINIGAMGATNLLEERNSLAAQAAQEISSLLNASFGLTRYAFTINQQEEALANFIATFERKKANIISEDADEVRSRIGSQNDFLERISSEINDENNTSKDVYTSQVKIIEAVIADVEAKHGQFKLARESEFDEAVMDATDAFNDIKGNFNLLLVTDEPTVDESTQTASKSWNLNLFSWWRSTEPTTAETDPEQTDAEALVTDIHLETDIQQAQDAELLNESAITFTLGSPDTLDLTSNLVLEDAEHAYTTILFSGIQEKIDGTQDSTNPYHFSNMLNEKTNWLDAFEAFVQQTLIDEETENAMQALIEEDNKAELENVAGDNPEVVPELQPAGDTVGAAVNPATENAG